MTAFHIFVETYKVMIQLLQNPAFWAALFGSSVSLAGVWISNVANDKRLQKQLDHDRHARKETHEYSLKKDIFLAATEAVYAGQIAINQFANLELSDDQVTKEYVLKAPAIAKLHIVANEKSVRAVINYNEELSAAFLKLFIGRIKLKIQKKRFEDLKQASDKYLENLLHFIQECAMTSSSLVKFLVPAVVEIRNELNLIIDPVAYETIILESNDRQKQYLLQFLNEIQNIGDGS